MSPQIHSTEMLQMMEEVADKAAERAAERVGQDLRLEMFQMEARMKDSLRDVIEEVLGMDTSQHVIEHAALHDMIKLRKSIFNTIVTRVATGLIILALAASSFSGVPLVLQPSGSRCPSNDLTRHPVSLWGDTAP